MCIRDRVGTLRELECENAVCLLDRNGSVSREKERERGRASCEREETFHLNGERCSFIHLYSINTDNVCFYELRRSGSLHYLCLQHVFIVSGHKHGAHYWELTKRDEAVGSTECCNRVSRCV